MDILDILFGNHALNFLENLSGISQWLSWCYITHLMSSCLIFCRLFHGQLIQYSVGRVKVHYMDNPLKNQGEFSLHFCPFHVNFLDIFSGVFQWIFSIHLGPLKSIMWIFCREFCSEFSPILSDILRADNSIFCRALHSKLYQNL
jgi:hypothetical protein